MLFGQLGMDKYIANEIVPGVAKEGQLIEEIETQKKWMPTPNRFTTMGDADMIHISGAMTVQRCGNYSPS